MSLFDTIKQAVVQLNNLNNPEYQQYQVAEQQILPVVNLKKHTKTRAIPFPLAVLIAFCVTAFFYVMIEGVPEFDQHVQNLVNQIEQAEY